MFLESYIGLIHCLVDHRLFRHDGSDTLSGMSVVLLVVVVRCRVGFNDCDDRVMNISVVVDISIVDGVGTMVG